MCGVYETSCGYTEPEAPPNPREAREAPVYHQSRGYRRNPGSGKLDPLARGKTRGKNTLVDSSGFKLKIS